MTVICSCQMKNTDSAREQKSRKMPVISTGSHRMYCRLAVSRCMTDVARFDLTMVCEPSNVVYGCDNGDRIATAMVVPIVHSPQRPTRPLASCCCRRSMVKTRAEKHAAETLVAPVDKTNRSCPTNRACSSRMSISSVNSPSRGGWSLVPSTPQSCRLLTCSPMPRRSRDARRTAQL